jgi:hypothetical protein
MKKSSDTIGNRTRNHPVCSAVPQPLRHREPPEQYGIYIYIYIYTETQVVTFHNAITFTFNTVIALKITNNNGKEITQFFMYFCLLSC